MDPLERVEGDLRFVRGALETSNRQRSPGAIYFLWAAVVLVGFSLVDFLPSAIPLYWSVAGPAGFLASAYLGWRHGITTGQQSTADGRRHLLHWGAVLVVVFLALLMPARGFVPWNSLNEVMLLMLTLGYFTAGVQADRPLMWIGVLLGLGYVVVTLVSAYAWTMVGIALAIGLAIAGLRGGRSHEAAC
jgi:hypothetical protein